MNLIPLLLANMEQPPWGNVGQVVFSILLFAIVFVPLFVFAHFISKK